MRSTDGCGRCSMDAHRVNGTRAYPPANGKPSLRSYAIPNKGCRHTFCHPDSCVRQGVLVAGVSHDWHELPLKFSVDSRQYFGYCQNIFRHKWKHIPGTAAERSRHAIPDWSYDHSIVSRYDQCPDRVHETAYSGALHGKLCPKPDGGRF